MVYATANGVAEREVEAVETTFESDQDASPIEACVELHNLSFRYGEHQKEIFTNINLRVKAGEFGAIAGPSGCGKPATLLAAAA